LKLLILLAVMCARVALAAETELPIPLARPGEALHAYVRLSNASDTPVTLVIQALAGTGAVLESVSVALAAKDTQSLAVREVFAGLPDERIARVKVVHPPEVTVQLAFGARPPERPKAFSVPV
jgi:hypothetical protein